MPRRPRKPAPEAPDLSDESLSVVFNEFLPARQPTRLTVLSQPAFFEAIRQVIGFSQTLTSDTNRISQTSAEVTRIMKAAEELRDSLVRATPHTLRLILGGPTLGGRRRAMFVRNPHSEHPWTNNPVEDCLKSLDALEPSVAQTTKFLTKESGGGPGTLLTRLHGTRNYHFGLQSRVLLAALGHASEAPTSRKVCRMTAAFISLVGEAVTEAGTRQYAQVSWDFIEANPEEFEGAYLRLLERDLSTRYPKDDPNLLQIRARLSGGPTSVAQALINSTGS